MHWKLKVLIAILALAITLPLAATTTPAIYYLNMLSGPVGTILTINGNNFGPTQGGSTVTVNGHSVSTYNTWTNTRIQFTVAAGTTTGAVVVTVASVASICENHDDGCSFTVRTGTIYYVGPGGNDSNAGTVMGSPWLTLGHADSTAGAGAIIYVLNGFATGSACDGRGWHANFTPETSAATSTAPIQYVVYPGATATIGTLTAGSCSGDTTQFAIRSDGVPNYLTFSGFTLRNAIACMEQNQGTGWRWIDNDCRSNDASSAFATFQTTGASIVHVYGNVLHDLGGNAKLNSGMYFTSNSNHLFIGWNQLGAGTNTNSAMMEIHSTSGNDQYDVHVHDNYMQNCRGDCLILTTVDPSMGPVEVYNNVFYNCGLGPNTPSSSIFHFDCISMTGELDAGPAPSGTVLLYNNTFVNYGSFGNGGYGAGFGAINLTDVSGQSPLLFYSFVNNVFSSVSTAQPYFVNQSGTGFAPGQLTGCNTNIYYNGGAAPSQCNTGQITSNPLFVSSTNFNIQTGSPAIGAGTHATTSAYDYNGQARTNPPAIGAYELIVTSGGGGTCNNIYSDNFMRSNGPIGSNWTANMGNPFNILSSSIQPVTTSAYSLNFYNAGTFTSGQCAQLTISQFTMNVYIGPAVTLQASAQSGYLCVADGTGYVVLQKMTAGSATTLATSNPIEAMVGDIIYLQNDGSGNLTCTDTAQSVTLTATDTTFSGGKAGVAGFGNGNTYAQSWVAGNLTTIVSITLSPGVVTMATGGTSQLTATATNSDSSTTNITATATWTSADTGVATVSVGLVTGVSHGTSSITATLSSVTSPAITANVTAIDIYGGNSLTPCVGTTNTGYFHLYKDTSNHHWMHCDPLGNQYWYIGMQEVDGGYSAYTSSVNTKYGSGNQYAQNVIRLRATGFNGLGWASIINYWPVNTNNVSNANPQAMPFTYQINPMHDSPGGHQQMDVFANAPPQYDVLGGYRGYVFADVFNSNFTYVVEQYAATSCCSDQSPVSGGAAALDASPYFLATELDDTDYAESWNGGATHLGYVAGMMPPYMWTQNVTHNRGQSFFTSPTVSMKAALQTYLTTEYTNVAGLNSAWSSTYTTLGSSATTVTNESMGTGNGSTVTFSHTFAHGVVDPASLLIEIAGSVDSGDSPWFNVGACTSATNTGCIQGNTALGSVSYKSGGPSCGGQSAPCVTVTFPTAPTAGQAVTVTYQYGGWPKALAGGTGLLDEDGTSTWYPATLTPPDPPTGTQVGTDLDGFLGAISKQYHSTINTWIKAQLPHHLLFSADPMSPYTRAVILANAAPYLDAIQFGSIQAGNASQSLAQSYYNTNGVPVYAYEINAAQPDSPYNPIPCPINPVWCFTTQAARGAAYLTDLNNYWTQFTGSDSYHFVIGSEMWQFTDNPSENGNYGLVTLNDNLYGWPPQCSSAFKEDVNSSITDCYGYTTIPQSATYGNFLTGVVTGNMVWLTTSTSFLHNAFGGLAKFGGAGVIQ